MYVKSLVLLSIVVVGAMGSRLDQDARADTGANQEPKAAFFVAAEGNDAWSGKLAAPNAEKTDGPFATLGRARDAVRDLKAKQKQPITVMVRGAKYLLDETVVFGPQDSGTRESPITYRAYPGEKPILSGGRRVTGWKLHEGKILRGKVTGGKGSKLKVRQLTFNGKLQVRARWPNTGWASMEGPAEPGSHIAFKYKPEAFPRHLAKPKEAEINVRPYIGWCNSVVSVASVDEGNRIVTLAHEVWRTDDDFPRYANMPFKPNNKFVLLNVLEELDQPGEWCLDSEEGIVYFWPPEEFTEELTDDSQVVIPGLDCLIDLRGVSHVTISGFTFTETTSGDNYHRFGLEGYGAMFPIRGWKYCGEAVHLKDAKYCTLQKNRFYALGGNAVYLEGYNLKNQIRRNEFSHVGANGVCLLGTMEEHPMFNQVTDNEFHHTGAILMYTAAVSLGLSDGNLIAHNSIHDMPHHAINLGASGYGRNVVEYNDIRRGNPILYETPAINAWMDPVDASKPLAYVRRHAERIGHIIRYNLIVDKGSCGIGLDDYGSNCLIQGNIVVGPTSGIGLHGGKNNVVENNILARSQRALHYSDGVTSRAECRNMSGFNTGNLFRNNIIYSATNLLAIFHYSDKLIAESDNNLFFNPGGKYNLLDSAGAAGGGKKVISLGEWQKLGYDTHSLTADPLFVDAEHGDYRLKPESPAFKLGFQPIPVHRIGVRAQ